MDLSVQKTGKGLRNDFLEAADILSKEGGFEVPKFKTLGFDLCKSIDRNISGAAHHKYSFDKNEQDGWTSANTELIKLFYSGLINYRKLIGNVSDCLHGTDLLVRPSPLDEYLYPGLSFAGVYLTHVPKGQDNDLIYAAAKVLAGRFTRFANLYYRRHQINSSRIIGLMFMKPVNKNGERNLIHGTAYIAENHLRTEYIVQPITNETQSDPHILSIRDGIVQFPKVFGNVERSLRFSETIQKCMVTLHNYFKKPIDVEYLFAPNGKLNVVQVRYMSGRHCDNWAKVPMVMREEKSSAIINTVGVIHKRIFDCRERGRDLEGIFDADNIIVVRHKGQNDDYGVLDILEMLGDRTKQEISLIIDHGNKRVRDHIQYIIPEDPAIKFVYQSDNQDLLKSLKHGKYVIVNSDGIQVKIVDSN